MTNGYGRWGRTITTSDSDGLLNPAKESLMKPKSLILWLSLLAVPALATAAPASAADLQVMI